MILRFGHKLRFKNSEKQRSKICIIILTFLPRFNDFATIIFNQIPEKKRWSGQIIKKELNSLTDDKPKKAASG